MVSAKNRKRELNVDRALFPVNVGMEVFRCAVVLMRGMS